MLAKYINKCTKKYAYSTSFNKNDFWKIKELNVKKYNIKKKSAENLGNIDIILKDYSYETANLIKCRHIMTKMDICDNAIFIKSNINKKIAVWLLTVDEDNLQYLNTKKAYDNVVGNLNLLCE